MLEINEITDKTIWEKFLLSIEDKKSYPFFQSWNWGEVQKKMGFPILRIGIFKEGVLVGVVLIVDVKAKRGHYLHLRHGPVLTDFEKYFTQTLLFVKKLAKSKKASFIRISPLIKKNEHTITFLKKLGFHYAPIHNMDAEVCSILSLSESEEDILKHMRKSHRYLIKKAQSYGIDVIKSKEKNDIQKFLHLYQHFSSHKHFVAHKGIIEEFEILGEDNQAMLFLAEYHDKIIAGMLIDFVGYVAIYHHAASDSEYKQIPVNYLLLWEAMKEAKKRGKEYFNLFGIAPDNKKKHPWSGFTLFKTGFGGETVEFMHAMDLPLHPLYMKTYVVDWITKKRKGY
jgi:lipid II:glycine glycyltransferase (peptidoglycan interpeptide bridge formation enzyme)